MNWNMLRVFIKSADDMQSKYMLKNDAEVNLWLTELKNRMHNKECENYAEQYDILIF